MPPTHARRKDTNQPGVEQELRDLGFSVLSIHTVGKGCPDLVVGALGLNFIVELKHDFAALTEPEKDWHKAWQGQVRIAETAEEIIRAFAVYAKTLGRKLDGVVEFCEIALAKIKEANDA